MAKLITIKETSLTKKVSLICKIFDWQLSESELNLMVNLIGTGMVFLTMDADLNKELRDKSGLNESTFNVMVSRLNIKGVIKKTGRTVIINPAFNGIADANEYLIRFVTG